jgi:hypothetical protein
MLITNTKTDDNLFARGDEERDNDTLGVLLG